MAEGKTLNGNYWVSLAKIAADLGTIPMLGALLAFLMWSQQQTLNKYLEQQMINSGKAAEALERIADSDELEAKLLMRLEGLKKK